MKSGLVLSGFEYTGEIVNADGVVTDRFTDHNLIPQVGVNHIVSLIRGSGAPIASWFLGLFEGNYVPTSGVTAADLQSTVQESLAYDEASRPAWTHAFDGVGVIDNLANRAVFTFNAPKTIYGAFLISNSVKGGTTGTLLSIARFASPKPVEAGGEFRLTSGITLIPTNTL